MFERTRLPIKNATSFGSSTPKVVALAHRIATRVSRSGGSTATVKPQPNRDFSRSSNPSTSLGKAVTGRDDLLLRLEQGIEGMENLPETALYQQKLTSSISSAFTERIFRLNSSIVPCCSAFTISATKPSGVHVKHLGIRVVLPDTVADGVHRCVLPNPTPP